MFQISNFVQVENTMYKIIFIESVLTIIVTNSFKTLSIL
jgi:hypothetical protein